MLRLLNELLVSESKDPRLDGASISSVELSRDLSVARVYISLLDPDAPVEPVLEGFASAAGFFRSRVGKALQIRHAPELRFHYDDSIARGHAISELIRNADKGSDESE